MRDDFKLETGRLSLRKMDVGDADFICELLNTPGWLKYIGDRGVRSKEDAEKYIQGRIVQSYTENGFGMYAMILKEHNVIIGACGLIKRAGLDNVDIGFAILPAFEGKGYTFEAASTVVQFAETILKLPGIAAITTADNQGSINIIKKIGLEFMKTITLPDDDEALLLFEKIFKMTNEQ